MPDSPLDEIIMQVQSNDIAENRLILFKRFLDAELFILIDDPQDPKPKLVNLREGQILLGFDTEEKLMEFAGDNAFFLSMTGRNLLAQNVSVGIALNLTNIGGGYILTNEILRWLEKNTQAKQGKIFRHPKKIVSPSIASETFIKLLDETLALSPGSANYAILVQDISEETNNNLLLIFVEAGEAFQNILAQQISEAFKLSNLQSVTLDIIFASPDEELIKKALKIGLRFDLPLIQEAPKPKAPGLNPKEPPILR